MQDHAAVGDHRRGRRVGVVLRDPHGLGHVEQMQIVNKFSGVLVHANGEQLSPVSRGRGQPNLIAPDHWRRPAPVVDGRFSNDVFCL